MAIDEVVDCEAEYVVGHEGVSKSGESVEMEENEAEKEGEEVAGHAFQPKEQFLVALCEGYVGHRKHQCAEENAYPHPAHQ